MSDDSIKAAPGPAIPVPQQPSNPPAPIAPAAPAPEATPRATTGDGDLTSQQAHILYQDMARRGELDQPTAQRSFLADLAASGEITPQAAAEHQAAGTVPDFSGGGLAKGEIVSHLVSEGMAPATKPTDYVWQPQGDDFEPVVDNVVRTALLVGGFSPEVGSNIGDRFFESVQKTAGMTDEQRVTHRQEQERMIRHVLGPRSSERIAGAVQLVRELSAKAPGFAELLDYTGAGDDAALVVKMVLHYEALDKRAR